MPKKAKEYAVYKGDTFICLGTARECAEFMEIKLDSFYFYISPSYKKRSANRKYELTGAITIIEIEDEVIA